MEIGTLNQRITILEHRTASETTDAGVTKEVQKL